VAYVVQRGDTLSSIARQFYGKSSLGGALWRANRNLVAHPDRLTPGDTIYIFPESTLTLKKAIEMPPEPDKPPVNLYKENDLLNQSFPKSVSLLTTVDGRTPTRIHIKRLEPRTGEMIDQYMEVRIVGEVLSSVERGLGLPDYGHELTRPGRTLLSTRDQVILRFTEDLAKILDSDTYDDSDPYFRSFPIYSVGPVVNEPGKGRADYLDELGNLLLFKGIVTIDARIEGLNPASEMVSGQVKRKGSSLASDFDPVSYHGFITYSEDPIMVADKVLIFVPLDPGPERRLDPPYVESPDTYVSPGK
jgi:hypothetical protein